MANFEHRKPHPKISTEGYGGFLKKKKMIVASKAGAMGPRQGGGVDKTFNLRGCSSYSFVNKFSRHYKTT